MFRAVASASRTSVRSFAQSARCAADQPSKREVDELFAEKPERGQQPRRKHAFSTNKVELVGGLSLDPLLRQSKANRPYLVMNIITNHSLRNADGTYFDETERHAVHYFGPQAENLSKALRKGTRVMVLGRLHYTGGQADENGVRTPRQTFIRAETVQQLARSTNPTEDVAN